MVFEIVLIIIIEKAISYEFAGYLNYYCLSYCAKERKKESTSQLPRYFCEHRTGGVHTYTYIHSGSQKNIYTCYIKCLLTIKCERKEITKIYESEFDC